MDSTILEMIQPKHSLKNSLTEAQLIAHIVESFKDTADLHLQKDNPEFIKYICNLVENVFLEKSAKGNKKQIVIKIIQKIIPNVNPEDLKKIDKDIEFLHSNKQIKKIGTSKYVLKKVTNFFCMK